MSAGLGHQDFIFSGANFAKAAYLLGPVVLRHFMCLCIFDTGVQNSVAAYGFCYCMEHVLMNFYYALKSN